MDVSVLLNELETNGINVSAEGMNLRVRGRLSAKQRNMLKASKILVLEHLSALAGNSDLHGVSKADLSAVAEDDWEWIEKDEKAQQSLARCVHTSRLLRAGRVPEHYTGETNCSQCGVVPIFAGCPPEVLGCPWCFVGGYR